MAGTDKIHGDSALAVVVDAAGDVFAGGQLANNDTNSDLVVLKFDGTSGTEVWRREIDGGQSGFDSVHALALAGADVVAAGNLHTSSEPDFAVLKFDGSTGEELWRQLLPDGLARAVAVDDAGDVLAVGRAQGSTGWTFVVVKYHGATGAELWRSDVESVGVHDGAVSVSVSAGGDVVASGVAPGEDGFRDFFVVALDGATGTELWRQRLSGGESQHGSASRVRFDPSGDVFAIGHVASSRAFVLKFDGDDGSELWRTQVGLSIPGEHHLEDLLVDGAGSVWAAGRLGPHFGVVKLEGSTGIEDWATEVATGEVGTAAAIDLDPAGNPIATGAVRQAGTNWLSVAKLDGVTGAELWRQQIRDPKFGPKSPEDIAVDPHGDPIAVGASGNPPKSSTVFEVVKLDGVTGSTCGLAAKFIAFIDPTPEKRRVQFLVKDELVMIGWGGSSSDPRQTGATLTLHNPTTSETAEIPLPAAHWTGLGNPPGKKGYRFRAPVGANPCKVIINPAKFLRATCSSKRGPLPFTLDEPSQGRIAISFQAGATAPLCAEFGGSTLIDVPGFFKARKVPRGGFVCP